ncbi:NAD(P)-binding protein [Lysobacter arenosi]|uniref:NAD(P)-binding protein n=1 Tax=Lysobacter arenosi TaxID=2795387 RepID=A0ABX7RIS4_9GAMM|nr:NAD(P)-binding protein [Lysobacter arenosi]
MTNTRYDILIVGAGHNGLVAATYLAKAGKKVLVLEQRDRAGGQLATDTLGDSSFDPLHAGAQLRPDIVADLGLARHGLGVRSRDAVRVIAARRQAPASVGHGRRCRHARIDPPVLRGGRRTLARVRRLHGSRRRLPRCGLPHADAAPAACRPGRRLATGEAGLDAAPPRRPRHVPGDPGDVDVDGGIHRGMVRVGAGEGRGGGRRHPRPYARLDVGRHRLHADAQLAQPRRPRPAGGRRRQRQGGRGAGGGIEGRRWRAAHGRRRRTHPGRLAAGLGRAPGQRRGDRRDDGAVGRRSASHPVGPGRRAGAAAGLRLAGAVDQDARRGRQGPPADQRQPRPAGGNAGDRTDVEVPRARVRRSQVRRAVGSALPGGHHRRQSRFHPRPVGAVQAARNRLGRGEGDDRAHRN